MKQIQTITEQTYQEIRQQILNRELPPGTRLGIKFLQERLGVSSSPIREALTHLLQDGLIEYRPNVGMRVITFTPKDVEEIFHLMRELDAIAMRFSFAQPNRNELIARLQELNQNAHDLLKQHDYEQWETCSDNFHLIFYDYADNSRLNSYADKARLQLTAFSIIYQQDASNCESIQQEHDAVLSFLEKGDLPGALEAFYKHFDTTLGLALQVLEEQAELS